MHGKVLRATAKDPGDLQGLSSHTQSAASYFLDPSFINTLFVRFLHYEVLPHFSFYCFSCSSFSRFLTCHTIFVLYPTILYLYSNPRTYHFIITPTHAPAVTNHLISTPTHASKLHSIQTPAQAQISTRHVLSPFPNLIQVLIGQYLDKEISYGRLGVTIIQAVSENFVKLRKFTCT